MGKIVIMIAITWRLGSVVGYHLNQQQLDHDTTTTSTTTTTSPRNDSKIKNYKKQKSNGSR